MRRYILVIALLSLLSFSASGQQSRLNDYNQISWFVYNGDHKVSQKWAIHTEYQWRRVNWGKSWQQSLARLSAVYAVNDRIAVSSGYTYFVTYPYGDYPTADTGVPFPEHRLHEDIELSDAVGIVALKHRLRLEQRWIGEAAEDGSHRITGWEYQNRIRYQLAATLPLQGRTLDDREFYLSFFDELFISFGPNVGYNTFNQNRIYGAVGYQFQKNFKLELGYLYQITQHAEADPITNSRVFEMNNGFRLNVMYDLDFTK
ncbi:hypothetical protein GCM10027341_02400 [Spirosoma knui]